MYATSPLTVSQVNDLKAWTAQANEDDQMTAGAAWQIGVKDNHHRVKEQDLISLEREQREARDQERWRREKRRGGVEREVAWEERKRDVWGKYFRQRADEGARRAGKTEERIRRMEAMGMGNEAITTMEGSGRVPDRGGWRKAVLERRFRTGNRWGSGHYRRTTSATEAVDRSMRYLIYNGLSNMEWEVVTRITARVNGANQTRMNGALDN